MDRYSINTACLFVNLSSNVLHARLEMARRKLGTLRNLGGHATANSRKTTLEKIRRSQPISLPKSGKENKVLFHYRLNPPSKNEADLHQNIINTLAAVTLTEMRRYVVFYFITNCTLIVSKIFTQIYDLWSMDAYQRGLNGRQAAWAKKSTGVIGCSQRAL